MMTKTLEIPKQVYWEDVNEGDEIPAVDFMLTVQRMIIAAGANRNFSPLHHNTNIGRAAGAEDMFLQNGSCLMLWERVVSDWCGIYARVKKVTFRITDFHTAGDVIHVGGKIAKKYQENGLHLVDLKMQSDTPRKAGMVGTVVVALPTRARLTATPCWNADGVAY
jgi:hypothetical protein